MSYNDPFESEGTAGTVNFDAPAGGGRFDSSASNLATSSDDGGDSYVPGQGISLTKATRQEYVPGQGFTFSMPSASDTARQQRLSGMGDYRNSEAYERYKRETGRSLQNPYGNTGLFSGIFGADRVNYNMDPAQAQNILDIGFDRYMNFDQQPEYAQSKGFGKLFGSPEGEMTAQGELRAQVPETTTAESLLSSIIPGAGFLPTPGTTYAPMGSTSYDPERDPSANQDLRSGPFSLLTDALSKGREFISNRLNPLPDAPPSRPRAPVQETRRDIIDTRTPAPPQRTVTAEQQKLMDEISQGMDTAGLDSESRANFLDTIISQDLEGGAVYNSAGVPVISYTPERAVNPDTGKIFGDDDRAADYQIAAARLKEIEDFNAAPTYPQSQNFGDRQLDPINPLTVDFLNDINLGQLSDIVGKVQSGDLLSKQTPFGTLSIEPEFDGVTPVGAMLRLKGTF